MTNLHKDHTLSVSSLQGGWEITSQATSNVNETNGDQRIKPRQSQTTWSYRTSFGRPGNHRRGFLGAFCNYYGASCDDAILAVFPEPIAVVYKVCSLSLCLLFAWMYYVVMCELQGENVVDPRKFTFLHACHLEVDRRHKFRSSRSRTHRKGGCRN